MTQKEIREIKRLQGLLSQFASERDWEQFHTPENLIAALSVECSELLELLNWSFNGSRESKNRLLQESRARFEEEIADVFLLTIRLCDILDINILQAAEAKIRMNAEKYPVESARGNNKKYNDLE